MDKVQQYSLALDLICQLHKNGSWCGETHLQKSMYFLEELLEVPTDYSFILYKHGPFSFDFRNLLNDLRVRDLISYKHIPPYGPQLIVTKTGNKFLSNKAKKIEKWTSKVNLTAKCLGNKGVVDLEKLATALMVSVREKLSDDEERAIRLNELKPHISKEEALSAVQEYDSIAGCLQKEVCLQ